MKNPQARGKYFKSLMCKKIELLYDALIWCSATEDFQEGGKARKGWLKLCRPLLDSMTDEKIFRAMYNNKK